MARARNIKPGFFDNEELAELGPEAMLLFVGLWTLADREGRLEDRPRRIKAQVFPYFDVNVDATLDALAERTFIVRYVVADTAYIQVINFTKHQRPHSNESQSVIPACPECAVLPFKEDPLPTMVESPVDQGEHGFGLVLDIKTDSLVSDSLIPDCGLRDSAPERDTGADEPRKPKRKARTTIDPDFRLDDGLRDWTTHLTGWPFTRIEVEVTKFREHHGKLGNTMADWGLAWHTWARKALEIDADKRARASPAANGRATAQDFLDLMHEDVNAPPGHAETVIDAAYTVSDRQALGAGGERHRQGVEPDPGRR
jgi:hypothetical protein